MLILIAVYVSILAIYKLKKMQKEKEKGRFIYK